MMNALHQLQGLAETWQVWMISMAWQAAVLAGVVWGVTQLLRRAPASLRFSLWGLVILRLLLPPTLAAPWSPGSLAALTFRSETAAGTSLSPAGLLPPPGSELVGTSLAGPATSASEASLPAQTTAQALEAIPQEAQTAIPWAAIVFATWLAVTAGLLLMMTAQYLRYVGRVRRSLRFAPQRTQAVFQEQLERFGMSNTILLRISDRIPAPGVLGLSPPLIVLPASWAEEPVSEEPLAHVLAHELAHIRRRDLPIAWFTALVTCLYWFHPAVWVANYYLRREREMACDDMVIHRNETKGERYASTILTLSERLAGPVPTGAGFLGVLERKSHLRERMQAATDARRARRWPRLAKAAVLAVGLLLLPMAPADWAMAEDKDNAEPTLEEKAQQEIDEHYQAAGPEEKEYILWTARQFGPRELWLPADHFSGAKKKDRKEKVKHLAELLETAEYGRHLCKALAEAGALGDKALVPGLSKVAAYHRENGNYDCRPKWIAVSSLGRTDDERAIPVLIPLVDHGNQNVRIWARTSLARLTGKNFGDDKQAWGAWWNAQGKEPKLTEDDLKPWKTPEKADDKGGQTPRTTSMSPKPGEEGVSADVEEIVVTFDLPMAKGFSWTGGPPYFPETTGRPYWRDEKTCVLPVKLEPGRFYRVGINSTSHQNFRSQNGQPVLPDTIYFTTQGADDATRAKLERPRVVRLEPGSSAADVSPNTQELRVQFDIPMGAGMSFVGGGPNFPEITGKAVWNEDRTEIRLPVKLKPDWKYELSLNSEYHINFQSEAGVPMSPVAWMFTTGS